MSTSGLIACAPAHPFHAVAAPLTAAHRRRLGSDHARHDGAVGVAYHTALARSGDANHAMPAGAVTEAQRAA